MSKAIKIGILFVACGWSVLIATHCLTHHWNSGGRKMGYSSGKGCFDGECGHKGSLALCIACCGERCPQYALDCGDLCLEKFDPGSAQTEMGKAALRIGAKDATDYVAFCRDVQMLKVLQRSSNPRVSRLARALAREASDKSGLSILVAAK